MGSDKGLLKRKDLIWAQIAASKLSALQLTVLVSVNKKQVQIYSNYFKPDSLIVDDEKTLVKGPLLGLLSVHRQFPDEDLFVLACDMIDMEEKLLMDLDAYYQNHSDNAYVYVTDGSLQPLCGIYTSRGLKRIDHLLQQQELRKFSMIHILERMNAKYVSVKNEFEHCFANYNSSEQINDQSTECLNPSATRKM